MRRAPYPRRSHVELAGIGFCVGDKLWDGLGGKRWMQRHNLRSTNDPCYRYNVVSEVEVEFVVERHAYGLRSSHEEECIAVRGCTSDGLSGDIAGSTRAILNDKLLSEPLREPLPD